MTRGCTAVLPSCFLAAPCGVLARVCEQQGNIAEARTEPPVCSILRVTGASAHSLLTQRPASSDHFCEFKFGKRRRRCCRGCCCWRSSTPLLPGARRLPPPPPLPSAAPPGCSSTSLR
ncbi:unnamed protein product [Ectocarpus sp. 12 AP-2014]